MELELLERIRKFAEGHPTNRLAQMWLYQLNGGETDVDEYEISVFVLHDAYQLTKLDWDQVVEAFPEWFKES